MVLSNIPSMVVMGVFIYMLLQGITIVQKITMEILFVWGVFLDSVHTFPFIKPMSTPSLFLKNLIHTKSFQCKRSDTLLCVQQVLEPSTGRQQNCTCFHNLNEPKVRRHQDNPIQCSWIIPCL